MSEPTRPASRLLRDVLTLVLLGLAVHLILPELAALQRSLQVIRGMTWWAVGVAVAAQVFSYLGSGVLLEAIAAMTRDRLSVVRGTLITTASYSVGLVGGGMVGSGAATYRWVHGSGVKAEGALLAGWLPALVYDGALLFVAIFGLFYLFCVHKLMPLQALSFGLILLLLGLVAGATVWGARHRSRLTDLATRVARRWAALRRRAYDPTATEESAGRLFSAWDRLSRGGWRGPALGAALNTIFDMLTLYLVFVAAGHPISLAILLAGYGLPLLLGKAPLLPGGLGIVESTMTAMYTTLGVPAQVVVVVVLTYRFLSFWLPSLLGFALVPYLQHVCSGPEGQPVEEGDPR